MELDRFDSRLLARKIVQIFANLIPLEPLMRKVGAVCGLPLVCSNSDSNFEQRESIKRKPLYKKR